MLGARKALYDAEKEKKTLRWSDQVMNWNPVTDVWLLNPPKEMRAEEQNLLDAV